jgi:hypothetical protein
MVEVSTRIPRFPASHRPASPHEPCRIHESRAHYDPVRDGKPALNECARLPRGRFTVRQIAAVESSKQHSGSATGHDCRSDEPRWAISGTVAQRRPLLDRRSHCTPHGKSYLGLVGSIIDTLNEIGGPVRDDSSEGSLPCLLRTGGYYRRLDECGLHPLWPLPRHPLRCLHGSPSIGRAAPKSLVWKMCGHYTLRMLAWKTVEQVRSSPLSIGLPLARFTEKHE